MSTVDLADFEASKENFQPLKGGRKLATRPRVSGEESMFEEQLESYDGDDKLQVWLSYCAWIESAYPSGNKTKLLSVLERCTREFAESPQYKNDLRYLKQWIRFADLCADPRDVFAFLRANDICLCHALFWEAWAVTLEMKGAHADADECYNQGIARAAQPLKRLRRSHASFMARMARRALDQSANDSIAAHAVANENATPSRAVFGALPARSHVSAHRVPHGPTRGFGAPRGPAAPALGGNFNVYEDGATAVSTLQAAPKDPWAEAHTKENVRRAEKWSDFKVPQSKRAMRAQHGPSMLEPEAFTVYEDCTTVSAPDVSRVRDTGKRVEHLAYNPALLFFDHTDHGEGFEECQMEEKRMAHYAYESDEEAEEEEDEDDADMMDQTCVVGGFLNARTTQQREEPKESKETAKEEALEQAKETATGEQDDFDLHTKTSDAGDQTECMREAMSEIDAMFSETLPLWKDQPEKARATQNRAPLGARKTTMGDVLAWSAPDKDVEPEADEEELNLDAVLNSPRDDDTGSFLHRLDEGDDDTDPFRVGDVIEDDEPLLLHEPTERTFEIFCEATADLQEQKRAALAAVTPLISAAERAMRDKENAAAAAAAESTGDDTTGFVVFEDPAAEDEDEGAGFVNTKLLRRLRKSSIGLALKSRNMLDSDGDDYSDEDEPVSHSLQQRRMADRANMSNLLNSHDDLDRSPPTMSSRTQQLLSIDLDQTDNMTDNVTDNMSDSFRVTSPTVAIALRAVRPLDGGCIDVFAGGAPPVRAWLDALACDMLHMPSVMDARPERAPTAAEGQMLKLQSCSLKVQRELSPGVALVERLDDMTGVGLLSDSTFALKSWTGADAVDRASWSFWVAAEMKKRLDTRVARALLRIKTLELYRDTALTLSEYSPHGTLADAIGAHVRRKKAIDEPLAMFYAMELLRIVASMHRAGFLHMGISTTHILVRNDQSEEEWQQWSLPLVEAGRWDHKGIILMADAAIDHRLYPEGTTFTGTHSLALNDASLACGAARDGTPWTIQPDTHGIACVVHELLFNGAKLEMTKTNGRWAITKPLGRRVQQDMWALFFDNMLNAKSAGSATMLDETRQRFEHYLMSNPAKAKQIKAGLCRQQIMLFETMRAAKESTKN